MATKPSKTTAQFGLSDLPEGVFFTSYEEVVSASLKNPRLRGQVHHMRRAFEKLQLDGILCVDDRPTALFRELNAPVERCFLNELQKKAWNQNSATLLVILDPLRVSMFSCLSPPEEESAAEVSKHRSFVTELERTSEVLEAFDLAKQLASGSLYRRHRSAFNARQAVDRYLVGNLEALSERLLGRRSRKRLPAIHSFLGRMIFTAYLLDREVIHLSEYIRRKNTVCLVDFLENVEEEKVVHHLFESLFPALRREFNGSMFDTDLADEKKLIGKREIRLLRTFFRGGDLGATQLTLGFWAYDFSVIPVEIISAIYEKFLGLEDPDEKERKGAYYTPKNLAEMTVAEALRDKVKLGSLRFLDPSCGSGVFLVVLFHYLAEEWQALHPKASVPEKMTALIDFFATNLRGTDVNETACRLTCFSLYIALLDQFDPPTLRGLKEEVGKGKRNPLLPPILGTMSESKKIRESRCILHADFFEREIPLHGKFDFIVGNPPWVSRGGSIPQSLANWVYSEENPFRAHIGTSKARLNEVLIPQKQIAHAFLWKSTCHLCDDGRACLILPSQLLTNRTDAFQKQWFTRFKTLRVIHLADFRRFLFDNAIRPCLLFHFSKTKAEKQDMFEYDVPKVTGLEPRSGLIPVCAEDRKWVCLSDLLQAAEQREAASVWKSLMWTSPSDMGLLQALKTLPRVSDYAGEPDEGKRWIKGQGFKPWYEAAFNKNPESYGEPKPIPGKLSDPFIRTDDLPDFFVTASNTISLRSRLDEVRCKGFSRSMPESEIRASKSGFHRSPDERVFLPPVLLINHGFNDFCVSEKKIFFQHAVTGFHATDADEDSLYFFAAFLESRITEFVSVHLSSSYGIERERVFVYEILNFPFALPEELSNREEKSQIVQRVASEIKRVKRRVESIEEAESGDTLRLSLSSAAEERDALVAQLRKLLEPALYDYFDLSVEDIAIIEDTVSIYKPSATPESPDKDIPTCRPISGVDLETYCEWLTNHLNRWAKASQGSSTRSTIRFRAEYGLVPQHDLALVMLRKGRSRKAPKRIASDAKLADALGRLSDASRDEAGPFEYLRGMIHGTQSVIYLTKPALLGQWTRTRALDDAKSIFSAISEGGRIPKV